MKKFIIPVVCAIALATLSSETAKAYGANDGPNCVSGAEWQSLYTPQFGDEDHSARRSVIESAWGVNIVGAPNQYWQDTNPRLYSAAYNWCGDPSLKIIIVYRITSDAWQYALKGSFGKR